MLDTHSTSDTKQLPEIDDLYRLRLVSDPQVSPDGRSVAFVQTRLRKKKNDYASNIWVVPSDGSAEAVRFTSGESRDTSPRWSPDGTRMAFISTRRGRPQLYIINLSGGEAHRLTNMKMGVGEFEWSPDSEWIGFISLQKEGETSQENKESTNSENRLPGEPAQSDMAPMRAGGEWPEDDEPDEEDEKKNDKARVITRTMYKSDGEGYLEGRSHLFVVRSSGGTPVRITEGEWYAGTPRWSPDGKMLAYRANKEPDADWLMVNDIFVVPFADSTAGDAKRITQHNCSIYAYEWRPGGNGFVVLAHDRLEEGAFATGPQLWTVSMDGEIRRTGAAFDRPAGALISSDMRSGTGETRIRFSDDGRKAFFLVTSEGCVHVYEMDLDNGDTRVVVGGEREVMNFGLAGRSVIFAATSPTVPGDIYRADAEGGEQRLTNVNADVLNNVRLVEPQSFWIEQPGGTRVQGWIMMPPAHTEGEKHPLVVQIHGGPHMSFGNVYFHEFQAMAARGWVVLYTNPRGSQGYGQTFSDAILNDWGGVDYDDVMACVDYCVAQGDVDETRMGVAGGSYGGYMVTWIIGHTDRFRAAVASRMVSNLYSAWGTGDFTWLLWNWEMEGTPQDRTQLYLERSPITYANNIHTPLLITHAEDDLRTSLEQAEQMYVALKTRRQDVKMVLFPEGGHDVSRSGKPSLRVERMHHILDWFAEHFGSEQPEKS